MSDGRFLKMGFNERNCKPIIDINVLETSTGMWFPIPIPKEYELFTEQLQVQVSENRYFDRLISDVRLIPAGVKCSLCDEIQKVTNRFVKIPYTEDYLIL